MSRCAARNGRAFHILRELHRGGSPTRRGSCERRGSERLARRSMRLGRNGGRGGGGAGGAGVGAQRMSAPPRGPSWERGTAAHASRWWVGRRRGTTGRHRAALSGSAPTARGPPARRVLPPGSRRPCRSSGEPHGVTRPGRDARGEVAGRPGFCAEETAAVTMPQDALPSLRKACCGLAGRTEALALGGPRDALPVMIPVTRRGPRQAGLRGVGAAGPRQPRRAGGRWPTQGWLLIGDSSSIRVDGQGSRRRKEPLRAPRAPRYGPPCGQARRAPDRAGSPMPLLG